MKRSLATHTSFQSMLVLLGGFALATSACAVLNDADDTNGSADSHDPGSTGDVAQETGDDTTGGLDTDATGLSEEGTAGDDTEGSDTDADATWSIHGHACPGVNRTDALHRDDDGTLWVGCGTAATGYGLFYSEDGGPSWTEATVMPTEKLHQFRVNSISRGHDGALYVAGINANNSDMVLRLDTDEAPFAAESVLVAGNQVGTSFHVGTYRELSDGRALAEALNGTDMLYRPDATIGSDASTWTDTYGWFNGGATQILDLVVHDDQFYGVGSRISDPLRLFLPPTSGGAEPYEFVTLQMPHTGEMWGIAVDDDHVVAVGVNQIENVGRVYISGDDIYDVDGYTAHSLHDLIGADASVMTWARGTCVQGDRIAVVGERQPLGAGTGIVVLSEDGGETFTDITPEGVTATVSKCLFRPDGGLVVVGANGFTGIYD
jgi:hypothetical protein